MFHGTRTITVPVRTFSSRDNMRWKWVSWEGERLQFWGGQRVIFHSPRHEFSVFRKSETFINVVFVIERRKFKFFGYWIIIQISLYIAISIDLRWFVEPEREILKSFFGTEKIWPELRRLTSKWDDGEGVKEEAWVCFWRLEVQFSVSSLAVDSSLGTLFCLLFVLNCVGFNFTFPFCLFREAF